MEMRKYLYFVKIVHLIRTVFGSRAILYTANSIMVDIDNSQMCNMMDRVPKNDDLYMQM